METNNIQADFVRIAKPLKFRAPLFIVFADYLGYVSEYLDSALSWCEGAPPAKEVQQFLAIEAMCIYRAMISDYTLSEIKEWYEVYWPIFLSEYDEKLKSLEKQDGHEGDAELPFA